MAAFAATGSDQPFWGELSIALFNTVAAVVPAILLTRVIRIDIKLPTLADALWLSAGAALSAAIAAALGAATLSLSSNLGMGPALVVGYGWWFGNTVGMLTIAPLILAWWPRASWRLPVFGWMHLAALLMVTAIVAYDLFLTPVEREYWIWFIYPVLIWSALSFNMRGASITLTLVSAFAIWGATIGTGPFAAMAHTHRPAVFLAQQFSLVTCFTVLLLAAVAHERRGTKALQRRKEQLRRLSDASLGIAHARSLEEICETAAKAARQIIEAHQCVVSLTKSPDWGQAIHAVDFSDKYERWRDFNATPSGNGIYALVCEANRPMRMTQAELQAHPRWRGFGEHADTHPPLRGWLAAPLIDDDGRNLGLIQLSDRFKGEFTEEDEAILNQLASMAAVALQRELVSQAHIAALNAENAAREKIDMILSSISDAMFALDRQWRFTYINDYALELLDRSRPDLLGRNLWEEFPEAKDMAFYPEYHRALAENISTAFELYYPPMERWLSVRAYPHHDGLTVYFRDVTARVQSEARLRQHEKMEGIGQLTGGIAHDFNNHLTVVLGNADLLAEHGGLDPAARNAASAILTAAERASALTQRLLAFSRQKPLEVSDTSVAETVNQLLPMIERTIGEHIRVEFTRPAETWLAEIDASQLENALLNLAINARDAMPDGGMISIELDNVDISEVDSRRQSELDAGQYVAINVADTGCGISDKHLERIFEPFFSTKSSNEGTGLGLSMVYGFAKQSGGHVTVSSTPGEGTLVSLYLPRAHASDTQPDKADPTASSAPQNLPRGGETILVLEDQELVRQHARVVLEGLGYTVLVASTGEEALELLELCDTDLLLTDVILGEALNGPQLARLATERHPGLRVLFMSGYTDQADFEDSNLASETQLLTKPFRRKDIAHKVRCALDQSDRQR